MAAGATQFLATAALLGTVIALWGPQNVTSAVRGLPWWSFAAAGALGGAGVLTQAARWRIIARHHDITVGLGAAVARCWQAAFLNSVLPGGIAGDALRAADDSTDAAQRTRRRALASGFVSMVAERLVNTAVVFLIAGAVLLPISPVIGAGCLAVALIAAAISGRWLRRLPLRALMQVLGLSVLGWAAFAGLFVIAVVVLAPSTPPAVVPSAAAVALAGMSVPIGVGGWGIRELAVAWVFTISGLAAEDGIRASVGYGALALVSTAPGAAILVLRVGPRLRRARRFLRRSPGKHR